MPYAIEQKWIGAGKESVRGTSVDPTRFIPVGADSEMEYKLSLIEDEQVRGMLEKFPPQAGIKDGTGRIGGVDVTSTIIGELLNSLMGKVVTTDLSLGAYKHVFTRETEVLLPSYTIALYRGLNAKKYPLGIVKSMAFTGAVDGKLIADCEVLFKTEEAYESPATPTWEDPKPFMFFQTDFKIAGSSDTNVKDWTLTIDNGSVAQRTLNQSQDVKEILSFAKMLISGTFNIFLENETERTKFLDNTSTSLEIVLTGGLIGGENYHKLDIIIPQVHYSAYPFGNLDGLLGVAVSFNGYYKLADTKSLQIELTNNIVSY